MLSSSASADLEVILDITTDSLSTTEGIPGFTIEDESGAVVATNPGQVPAGRRKYSADGTQQDRSIPKRKAATHDYLLRSPRGVWAAFARKCKNEGLTHKDALMFLVKDWTTGRIEIEDLATRKR